MAAARWNRARTLVAQPTSHVVFRPVALRAPIQHHLGRSAAVVAATRTQDRWRPWMMASVATAGVLSWQLSQSLVESESQAKPNSVIDEDSKVEFPATIPSEDGSPARLLGLGVRKITFLKVQVYVVGLYAKASDLEDHNSRFRALTEVQKFQRTDAASSDAAFRAIVQNPIELVLRIVPVRNTNGPHLRDGFVRNLTHTIKQQNLNDVENEEAMKGIVEFKNLFPKGKINAGQAMLFRNTRNTWLIESFFLGYLQGDNPISSKARDSIAQGIQDLLLQ
ncbi:Altered inheritance of mitochondria protein 18 mitochondrial [Mortierella sp. 14UC]|nr:Altered inheritance of mitochondria protein 18 mitochondrial [Mortierella sp. 14UC]